MTNRKIGVFLFLCSPFVLFGGGGWTPKSGSGFFSLSQRTTTGNYWASQSGIIGETPRASYYSTFLYAEYGLSDKWCGLFNSPLISASQQKKGTDAFGNHFEKDAAVGLGDIDLGMKRSLFAKKIALSTTLWLGIPTGDYTAGKTNQLHLGDGEFNQLLQVDASTVFGKFWTSIYVGYNNRTNNNSDDVHIGGELGFKHNSLLLVAKLNGRYSTFNGTREETIYPSIYSNNIEYLGLNTQAIFLFKNNWGVVVDAGFALQFRNIITVPSFAIGLIYDLKKTS